MNLTFTKAYLEILHSKYKNLNLTRIQTETDFYYKHYLDSVMPWRESPVFKRELSRVPHIVDVGFGGGFPLLPLAKEIPEKMFLGIEARRKKVKAVKDIAQSMNIPNIQVFHSRLEEIEFDREAILLFRAVGKIKDCLKLVKTSRPLLCFFYKGPHYSKEEELEGFNECEIVSEDVLNVEKTQKRMIVGVKIFPQAKNNEAKGTKDLSRHLGPFSVLVRGLMNSSG